MGEWTTCLDIKKPSFRLLVHTLKMSYCDHLLSVRQSVCQLHWTTYPLKVKVHFYCNFTGRILMPGGIEFVLTLSQNTWFSWNQVYKHRKYTSLPLVYVQSKLFSHTLVPVRVVFFNYSILYPNQIISEHLTQVSAREPGGSWLNWNTVASYHHSTSHTNQRRYLHMSGSDVFLSDPRQPNFLQFLLSQVWPEEESRWNGGCYLKNVNC